MDIGGRIDRVKQQLDEHDSDALLAVGGPDTYYLTGFHSAAEDNYPITIVPRDGDPVLLVSALDRALAERDAQARIVVPENGFAAAVTEHVEAGSVLTVSPKTGVGLVNRFTDEYDVRTDSRIIADLRMVKDGDEIDRIRAAYRLAERVLDRTLPGIENGMTENAAAGVIECALREAGADGIAFPTIVAHGTAGAFPHHQSGQHKIGDGPILIDMGCILNGYRSDMSRTVYRGEPTDRFLDIYEVVREAQERAETMLRPGVSAAEVDAAARDHITDAGYGDQFVHSTGHGVGISVHEQPNLSPRNDQELAAGMVVTIEPGIYLDDAFGVRIEDAYVITESGADRLTTGSRDLQRFS